MLTVFYTNLVMNFKERVGLEKGLDNCSLFYTTELKVKER